MPHYRIFGLNLRADIDLAALTPTAPHDADMADAGIVDVEIAAGPVAKSESLATSFRNWEAEPGRFLGTFHETGRFLVTGGRQIRYQRFPAADDSQVASVLLGTCMSAVLMQRGILPMHACSVATDRGAVLVIGTSGAGKSTMLGGLLELGYPMLADDVTGLVLDAAKRPLALPAFPATRLWADSLSQLGHEASGLRRVRSDMAKFYRDIERFHPTPLPLRAMVYLQPTNRERAEFSALDPARRIECLSRFVHRKNFLAGMGLRRWAFETAAETVRQVPMFHLIRPGQPVQPRELAAMLIDGIAQAELIAADTGN